jgi:hypothetical protein
MPALQAGDGEFVSGGAVCCPAASAAIAHDESAGVMKSCT